MRAVRFTWPAALLLCLGAPASVSAQVQTDSGDPTQSKPLQPWTPSRLWGSCMVHLSPHRGSFPARTTMYEGDGFWTAYWPERGASRAPVRWRRFSGNLGGTTAQILVLIGGFRTTCLRDYLLVPDTRNSGRPSPTERLRIA